MREKQPTIPDLPIERPKTRREARDQILQIYAENRWDADDRRRYEAGLGLAEVPLLDRPNEDYKVILDAMERSRMIIYKQ